MKYVGNWEVGVQLTNAINPPMRTIAATAGWTRALRIFFAMESRFLPGPADQPQYAPAIDATGTSAAAAALRLSPFANLRPGPSRKTAPQLRHPHAANLTRNEEFRRLHRFPHPVGIF